MTNQTAKQAIPKFKTEAQERAYWESHDSPCIWTGARRKK